MIDLEAIEREVNDTYSETDEAFAALRHFYALVDEIRRLRGQLYDAGLPDANDFPHPTGGIL